MTYLEAQVIFQDRLEPLLKTAGLPEYKLQSDVIIQFIYEAEIESILELCKQGQFENLRNYIVNDGSFTFASDTEGYYTCSTGVTDILWHVKSTCPDLTINYPTPGVSTNTEIKTVGKATNEFIPLIDVPKYITTSVQKHTFTSPKITLTNGVIDNVGESQSQKFIIITNSYTTLTTATAVKITYVKRPKSLLDTSSPLTYTSPLKADPMLAHKIIDSAVQKALNTLSTGKPKE
jgi:hypothetical protein